MNRSVSSRGCGETTLYSKSNKSAITWLGDGRHASSSPKWSSGQKRPRVVMRYQGQGIQCGIFRSPRVVLPVHECAETRMRCCHGLRPRPNIQTEEMPLEAVRR